MRPAHRDTAIQREVHTHADEVFTREQQFYAVLRRGLDINRGERVMWAVDRVGSPSHPRVDHNTRSYRVQK